MVVLTVRKEQEKVGLVDRTGLFHRFFAAVINSIAVLLFFRNIQFTSAISLAIYVGLLHFAALSGHLTMLPPMADAGFPYSGLFAWASTLPFWSALAASALVYIQALIINSLADSFRLLDDRSWLPGAGYALAASSLPDFQFLSPPLVAATFVAFALKYVFQTYKSPKSAILVFDAAFWVTVSSLFYPKALLLVIAFYFGIGVMRRWSPRDQIAFLVGVFVPVFMGWLWYFWQDNGSAFRQQHFGELFVFFQFDTAISTEMVLKSVLLGFLLLLYIINIGAFSRNKTMFGQKCVAVLYWVLFVGAGMLLLRPDWHWEVFVLTSAPAGIFLAMIFQNMRKGFAEGLHFALFCFVLLLQYFPKL